MGSAISSHNHNYQSFWEILINGEVKCTMYNRDEAVLLDRFMRHSMCLDLDDPAVMLREGIQ